MGTRFYLPSEIRQPKSVRRMACSQLALADSLMQDSGSRSLDRHATNSVRIHGAPLHRRGHVLQLQHVLVMLAMLIQDARKA